SGTSQDECLIPYGRKYEKAWLINVIQNLCSVPFTPVELHYANNRVVFYVEDASAANALKQVSRKIVAPDGYKLCMSKRYDGSQQALDLKNLHTDPDLVAQNIDMVLSRRSCMLAVLRIIQENIPELLSLNLSDNKLYRLDDMAELPQKAPNLKILNLSSNQLKTDRDLDRLKDLKLEELWLDGNLLCDSFPPTTLPPTKGSYFGSEDLKALILRFLQQYYTVYDSGDRQGLLDAYHDGACCSLSIPFSLHNHSRSTLAEYFKNSRNVKKLKDPTMRFRLLKHTKLNVVAFLSELPKTQHDINSFIVDVCAQTNTLLSFTVNGVFKEVDGKCRDSVRAFTRVFIVVPAGNNGLCIVNDQLFIRKATNKEIRKAFVMPAPTPSSSPVPTLTAEQQEMLQNFSLQSGMNLEWSQKCLLDNDWNYAHAAQVFTQLKVSALVPF
uniref:Nuclear RNA export factor 1 n=1 Tax=Podarcis muralis TaxID=64176 RepID=A0A670JST8_PODMU